MKIQFKTWMHPQMGVMPVDPKTPLILDAEIIETPKREWVGLTYEEAREIRLKVGSAADVYAVAIEAKLKEKNT